MRYGTRQIVAAFLTAAVLVAAGEASAQRRIIGPGPAADDTAKNDKSGLHVPQGKAVNFEYAMNDGAGYVWNIQSYGTVGSGTNNAYSGGMYLNINNNSLASRNQGWANEAGDEVELGPIPTRGTVQGNLNVYRRIKVYKDAGLARWIDIFQNTGSGALTFSVRIYVNFNWNVGRLTTSSGGATFGDKDFAMVSETGAGMGNNVPSTLHIVCDKKAKVRPTVLMQNNCSLSFDYNLTVPANSTVLLCHFEGQNTAIDTLNKDMASFKASKYLKDLPGRVRALIANFSAGSGFADIDLDRSESADTIILADEDPLYGTIQNESYTVQTLLGALTLPAEKVIGMAAAPGEEDLVRFVLSDGEVISGRSAGTQIALGLPSGGKLQVPLTKMKSWSYRISKARPDDVSLSGATVMLRTGDQLTFDPAGTKLTLRTRYGPVEVKADELLEIAMDNPSNGVHRATFLNGSRLAGILEPEKFTLTLKLGQKLEVPRDMIARIRFAGEEKLDDALGQLLLSNDDEAWGNLCDANITIATQYGTVDLRPDNVKSFTFSPSQPGRAALLLWDGTVLRGQLQQEELTYKLAPGPELKIPVSQITSIARSKILPPDDVRKKVERLVGMLGAESFKDRQTATDELMKMGAAIVPLLQKYVADADPEVRQRIGEVLEKLGGKTAIPSGRRFPGMIMEQG